MSSLSKKTLNFCDIINLCQIAQVANIKKIQFTSSKFAIFAILVAAFLSSGMSPFAKIVLQTVPPLSFTFIRFFFAFLILVIFTKKIPKLSKEHIPVILFSLLSTLNVILFAYGINKTTATIGQALYAGVPIVVLTLSYFFLMEKLTLKKVIGVLIGFIGVVIMILLPMIGSESIHKGDIFGNITIFLGVVLYSIYTALSKRMQKKYSPIELTSYFFLTTAIVQLFFLPFELLKYGAWWNNLNPFIYIAFAYIILLSTVFYYFLYQYAIKKASPIVTSMIFYLQPAVAYAWSYVLLSERLTPEFIIGTGLTLFGVYLTTTNKAHS